MLPHARRTLAEADDIVRAAAAGHARLRIGYAWSAMGRHTTPFQRRWAAEHPEVELQLVRTNSATAGLAEGSCDIAVVRTEPDQRRFCDTIVGLERRGADQEVEAPKKIHGPAFQARGIGCREHDRDRKDFEEVRSRPERHAVEGVNSFRQRSSRACAASTAAFARS